MELLIDSHRDYRRIKYNPTEKIQLANNGLQWILSSNVSAAGVQGDSLILRFHNGSLYEYPNQAKLYSDLIKSRSKGHFVWVKLRRTNVAYKKIGSLPFRDDVEVTDDDLFNLIDNQGLELVKRLSAMGLFIPNTPNVLDLIGLNGLLG